MAAKSEHFAPLTSLRIDGLLGLHPQDLAFRLEAIGDNRKRKNWIDSLFDDAEQAQAHEPERSEKLYALAWRCNDVAVLLKRYPASQITFNQVADFQRIAAHTLLAPMIGYAVPPGAKAKHKRKRKAKARP